MNKTKLSTSAWLTIILFGLIGQIAWAIENMEFNLFLFNAIGGTTRDIARMVAYSALVSTIATLVMGIISDKIGRRRYFLCVGYIIWGIMTMCFAFISRENTAKLFPHLSSAEILARTAFFVVFMDCIMSLFGSIANDASFNAWITETTDESNRGTVEGVLNVFPLLAMLIVAGASGIIVDAIGWSSFFIVMGFIVSICGVLGLLFVKEPEHKHATEKMNFLESILYGFKPSVIKKYKMFYLSLAAICIFNISVQIFMPYLLIYLEKTLQFDTVTYSLVMAIVILSASIISIFFGRLLDKIGKERMYRITLFIYALGLLLASVMQSPLTFTIAGIIMMSGYVAISIVFMAAIRDYTPLEYVGMFQGIRLLAYVLIPMVIGPFIGDYLTNNLSSGTYINEYKEVVNLPVSAIFVVAAIISLLLLIPSQLLFKKEEKEVS